MTGITIVFIHGNFVTKRCWEPWVARYEARGHTCITIAWPGRNQPVAELKRNPDDPFLGKLTIGEVIDYHVRTIQALPAKPIIIGHSFGGLLTQLMVQRDLAAAAVAIDSVPAQGALTLKWSFIRSLWPLLNPFIPASRPDYMPFEHFQYTFANDLPLEEQRAGYDRDIVPESRRVARGALSRAARVDFRRPHAPLLMIAGRRPHHARVAEPIQLQALSEVAVRDGVQGVPGARALHDHCGARMGGGGRLRARVGYRRRVRRGASCTHRR